MAFIHKILKGGGDEFLPFALAQERKLRATGLTYASQNFAVDGATIRVRLEGEHSFIEIEGSGGGYVVLPHSDQNPDGIKVKGSPPAAVPPQAVVNIKKKSDSAPKVRENTSVEAGANDWRGKVGGKDKVITFDASPQRYVFFGGAGPAKPGIYDGGKKIRTEITVPGVGTEDCGVAGAGIIATDGGTFYVMATTASVSPRTRLFIFFANVGSSSWKFSEAIEAPNDYRFSDPVYFSPDGKKFNTVTRHWSGDGRSKKVSGSITFQMNGGNPRLNTVSTVSGELFKTTEEKSYSKNDYPETATVTNPTADFQASYRTVYQSGYVQHNITQHHVLDVTTSNGSYKAGTEKKYELPVAFDYDSDSKEIPVMLSVTVINVTDVYSVGKRVSLSNSASSGDTAVFSNPPPSGNIIGEVPTAASASKIINDGVVAFVTPIVEPLKSVGKITTKAELSAKLMFDGEAYGEIKFLTYDQVNETIAQCIWDYNIFPYLQGGYGIQESGRVLTSSNSLEETYTFGQFVAADARAKASAIVHVTSSANAGEAIDDYKRKVKTELRFGKSKKEVSHNIENGVPLFKAPNFAGFPHTILTGEFSGRVAGFASLDGETFIFSVSPDEVLIDGAAQYQYISSPTIPAKINKTLNWMKNDGDKPNSFFSIGTETDFNLNPVRIF